ncbi:NEL-type E3 ubiquitin ligase domain-containing protein [Pseudomonas sp. MWU13-2105]|uniref:NEL-type E3 ubiquitin ligase domain-containing protein n=1 Tax=Pseudomonas sp. MWU13-2105 TaxID=2935074 RepID=UPI00200F7FE5|nr:NEL-type E3 ubiquitin ligase domain-containing protein [Pseudomonas sp. MWU13-2105]
MNLSVEQSTDVESGDETPSPAPAEVDDPLLSAFLRRDADLLHCEQSWARQQVVEHLASSFKAAMGPLHEAEQRSWLGRYRQLMAARSALDAESEKVVSAFEAAGLATLRERLKQVSGLDLDPHTTYLHTVIDAQAQVPQPKGEGPLVEVESFERRIGTVTVLTMTLWQAACLNFAFSDSHYANLKRRWISFDKKVDINDRRWLLSTEQFVEIVRELNLGAVLKPHVERALHADGPLERSMQAFSGAEIGFGVYDSARQSATTGLSYSAFVTLRDELSTAHPRLKGGYVALRLPGGLKARLDRVLESIESELLHLFDIEHEPLQVIYLPLLVFEVVGHQGLYSYCVERPEGALRYHHSKAAFEKDFKAQVQKDSAHKRLHWLISSLAFKQQHQFWHWIKAHRKPGTVTWTSTFADVYEWFWSGEGIDELIFEYGPARADFSPGQALAEFYAWRFRLNTRAIAVSKTEHDLQAVKEGVLAVMHLLLNVLMLPVPGGFGVLGRVVATMMFAQMGLELADGVLATFQGRPKALGQALVSLGMMILSGSVLGAAGRAMERRFQALSLEIGRWRKVTLGPGTEQLWKIDLSGYAVSVTGLAERFVADERGLFEEGGRLFGEVRENGRSLQIRLDYDAALKRYVAVRPDAAGFRPPMLYDPQARHWLADLDDSAGLSDAGWLARMMGQGTGEEAEVLLRISGIDRQALQVLWSGGLPPASLVEAVRRRQIDAGLDALIASSDARLSLPVEAERVLFCLLPRLPDWPQTVGLFIHGAEGELLAVHGRQARATDFEHKVTIRRLEEGGYVEHAVDSPPSANALAHEEGVQALILSLLPDDCPLKGRFEPFVRRQWNKSIRQQIKALARLERPALFEMLSVHDGLARSTSQAPARHYLSLLTPSLPPLVLKLQELYPALSLARIAEHLRRMPLDSRQRQHFLASADLPGEQARVLADAQGLTRLGRMLDGIHQHRAANRDTEIWLQLAGELLVQEQLGLSLCPQVRTSATHDDFYRALAGLFKPPELRRLGVADATDVKVLRKWLAAVLEQRRARDGRIRLPIKHCQERFSLPATLLPDEAGRYRLDGNTYLMLEGGLYRIENCGLPEDWRINPGDLPGAYTPSLEHNGASAWWHEFENPLRWDGLTAFRRLGGQAESFAEPVARQILSISATSDSLLRQTIFCNRRPPALLTAVMRHFRDCLDIERQLAALNWRAKALPALFKTALATLGEADSLWLAVTPESTEDQWVGALLRGLESDARRVRRILADGLTRQRARAGEPLASSLEEVFPDLPVGVADEILAHSEAWQRTLIRQTGRIPLALAEEARWWREEAILSRVLIGLSPDALGNAQSDPFLLPLLKELPGWPSQARIELRAASIDGALLDSSGSAELGKRRVVVKSADGYEAFMVEGEQVSRRGTRQSDLLLALSRVIQDLPARLPRGAAQDPRAQLKTLVYQQAIRQRGELRRRLGLRPAHAWAAVPWRLVRQRGGRIGIELSGRGAGLPPVEVFGTLKRLYRGATSQELFDLLRSLGRTRVEQRAAVEALEHDYRRLRSDLEVWLDVPQVEGTDRSLALRMRKAMASRIRRCWRWESRNVLGGVLLLEGFSVEQMPILNVPFKHVTQLLIRDMNLDIRYLSAFLRAFPALQHLRLFGAGLKRLPHEIGEMHGLQELDLEGNQIALTTAGALQLAGLRQLKYLNLRGNPLKLLPDFAALADLQSLDLSRTAIDAWPSGVLFLKQLVVLNLSHNRIQQVPDSVLLAPLSLNRGVNLEGNPLLPDSMTKLSVYAREKKGAGITFGLTSAELAAPVGIEAWGAAMDRTTHQNECWQCVRDEPHAAGFFAFLENLSALATFYDPQFSSARRNLTERVWRIMAAAADSADLCRQLFLLQRTAAAQGMERLRVFNELEFAVLCHQALAVVDKAAARARILRLLKGKFRLLMFWDKTIDPAIYRAYWEQLGERLELPDLCNERFYTERVQLDHTELETMVDYVREMETLPPEANGLHRYLVSQPFWCRFLYLAYEQETQSLSVQERESRIGTLTLEVLNGATERSRATTSEDRVAILD